MSNLSNSANRWPLTLVSAALGIGVITALMAFANMADRAALQREQQLLQKGFSGLLQEQAKRPSAVALWDDAVKNLDVSFDHDWTESNIGQYLAGVQGFELAVVLDREDQPVFAMVGDDPNAIAQIDSVLIAAAPIVEKVRKAEERRGPIEDHLREMAGQPPLVIYSTAVSKTDLGLMALTATLVQPDFGLTLPETSRSAVLISGEIIDQGFLSDLAVRYLLNEATLHAPDAERVPGHAALLVHDSSGHPVARIEWHPQSPGADMLRMSMPLVLVALVALIILAMRYQHRGRKATQRLIESEARVAHLAYHDTLTGLPNHLRLLDHLGDAIERLRNERQPFAVHCIDLNRFNEINDSFGQQASDDLIREVARLFSLCCGPEDLLARLGKDEFAIVQAGATPDRADALAARLMELAGKPVEIAAGRVFSGCTVGVALIDDPEVAASECVRRADLALNMAKISRKCGHGMYEPGMDGDLRQRLELREDLREALANGGLSVAYQPQVHQGGKLYGVEALARWHHPVRGHVPPSLFVPIAEESGLIDQLGTFVLRRAFEDSKVLGNLRIAVNISAAQIRLSDFVPELKLLVEETGVDTRRIELEITEGLLLGDDRTTEQTLGQLRDLGFRIALDDFGTGYSSLSYLQRYPIDKIKIDRSFISNLGTDSSADAVVNAIVRLARALRLDVIAEGVETEIQRVCLAAAGCDDIQGYLFGKPMPVLAIQDMMKDDNAPVAPDTVRPLAVLGSAR